MGTNYYFRTRFKELQESYLQIVKKVGGEPRGGEWIHLGKKSGGWRFCWNPNTGIEIVKGKIIVSHIYPLTRNGIQKILEDPDVDIEDEYGEIQDKSEFFRMAFSTKGTSGDSYRLWHPDQDFLNEVFKKRQEPWKRIGYTFQDDGSYDFENDRLIFSVDNCFS